MPLLASPPDSPARHEVAQGLLDAGVPTPFLAVSRDGLRAALARWNRHLPGVSPYYAVKANVDPLVLRELFAAGANADVASAYEIAVCRALGLGGHNLSERIIRRAEITRHLHV